MDSIAGLTGEPLIPRSWQRELIGHIFARTPDGRRRHRIAMVGMARKNGKTGMAAPIALYGLLAEGEGAQVYSCAADAKQAKLVFGAAKRMVELDPELRDLCKTYRDVIEVPSTGSIYRALSSEAYSKEGLSPSLVIYDELHAAPDRGLYDVMALAQGARVDPLMVIVTTAGVRTDVTGSDSIAYTLYQHGCRVATGEIEDPTFFMAWWEPTLSSAPLIDERGWQQANPGLGDILDPSDLVAAMHPGRMPESEARTKRLNQWVNSQTSWLPTGLFETRAVDRKLKPREPIVLGFDGSHNHDCTAIVGCTLDGFLQVLNLWERPPEDNEWKVPRAEVDAAVLQACRDYDVREITVDPFRWQDKIQEWEAEGLPAHEFPNTPSRMVPASQTFYNAVVDGQLTHSGDSRLVRHVNNTIIKTDRLGPRVTKEHRGTSRYTDLAIAALQAFDRATFLGSQPPPPKRLGAFLA